MKKKILIFITVFISITIGSFIYYRLIIFPNNSNLIQEEKQETTQATISSGTKILKDELSNIDTYKENLQEEEQEEEIDKKAKIEMLRKRFTLRGIISRGDNFIDENQPLLAMNEYLKALRESPDDETIIKKLSIVYFELKKYDKVIDNYEKILKSLTDEDKNLYLLSLIYELDFDSGESIKETTKKIKALNLKQEELFYYINAINCVIDFHECKKNYNTYFSKYENLSFEKLQNVKKSIDNYTNFQIENLYYKDALIVGSLFQDKMYNISNFLGEQILLGMPDYKPILLIVGKGYYELGDYENAKKYLEDYYTLEPKDLDITYLLGDINFKLKDYSTSNLYFNSALKNSFEPKSKLQRKLIYNYYLSGDKRSMLNVFSSLLKEKDSTIDDFSLGIYHAILEGRIENATYWSETGLEKFSDVDGYEIFYGYLGWICREEKDYENSQKYLKRGHIINGENPLITLNMGYLQEDLENYKMALIYFKKTLNTNGDGEFGILAKAEIKNIEEYLELSEEEEKENITQ